MGDILNSISTVNFVYYIFIAEISLELLLCVGTI